MTSGMTEADVRKAVRRLMAVFPTSKREDELVSAWSWVLKDVEPVYLLAAVTQYAKGDNTRFPSPGHIRHLALAKAQEDGVSIKSSVKSHNDSEACATCGAKLRLLRPEEQVHYAWDEDAEEYRNLAEPSKAPRFGVLHDLRKHREAGTPAIGYWK